MQIIDQISALPGVSRVFVQGSQARGTARPASDHDVVAVVTDLDLRMPPSEALVLMQDRVAPILECRLQRCSLGARGGTKIDMVPTVLGPRGLLWMPNVESGRWHPTDPEFEAHWFRSRAKRCAAVAASAGLRRLFELHDVRVGGYPVDYLCAVLAPPAGHRDAVGIVSRAIAAMNTSDLESFMHPQPALEEHVFQRVPHRTRAAMLRACKAYCCGD